MKTVASISPTADRFFGFPSDVTGLSVVLGTPTLSQAIGAQQLLAIVQAPPFQNDDLVCSGKPLLTMCIDDWHLVHSATPDQTLKFLDCLVDRLM